jgi:hypothetical protein
MKAFLALTFGVIIGAFLTLQYLPTVRGTAAQINHTSNQVSAKVGDVKKALTK